MDSGAEEEETEIATEEEAEEVAGIETGTETGTGTAVTDTDDEGILNRFCLGKMIF